MRIVHISDLHIGMLSCSWRGLLDKRVLGTLNWLLRRAGHFHEEYFERALAEIHRLNPELVICTGDVTCVSSPREFAAATRWLEPLRIAFGHHFLFVPGNHDAYVPDTACREALRDCFRTLNSGRWELEDLPVEYNVAGLRIFLLNEAEPVCWLLSTGRLSPPDAEWLTQRVAPERLPGERRLLVGHFPLRGADGAPLSARRRLDGADTVHALLREGRIDAALCGHVHQAFLRRENKGGIEVCAGSLTMNGMFNVMDWHPEDGRFSQFFVDVSGPATPPPPVGNGVAAVS